MRRDFADVDRPEGAADCGEFLRVADFLVSKKLRPGAVLRVAEVVGQLARRVPPASGLRRIVPYSASRPLRFVFSLPIRYLSTRVT